MTTDAIANHHIEQPTVHEIPTVLAVAGIQQDRIGEWRDGSLVAHPQAPRHSLLVVLRGFIHRRRDERRAAASAVVSITRDGRRRVVHSR